LFSAFVDDATVRLVGVEAAGDGLQPGRHAATLTAGSPGVLHGMRTYVLQNEDGQTSSVHSISAGLDYPGVGPEHAYWKESGRVQYVAVDDRSALDAFERLGRSEGILPALEPAHAVAHVLTLAPRLGRDQSILVNLSGRGDKDVAEVQRWMQRRREE
jgi:tryptophan synthase beta chain